MLSREGKGGPVNRRSAFAKLANLGQFTFEDSGEKTFPSVTKQIDKMLKN